MPSTRLTQSSRASVSLMRRPFETGGIGRYRTHTAMVKLIRSAHSFHHVGDVGLHIGMAPMKRLAGDAID
jgi:hypothetical protein